MEENKPDKKHLVPNHLLREERERHNWTHQDVADLIDLPDAHTVGRWEHGVLPQPHYRRELCRIFEKSDVELGLKKGKLPPQTRPATPIETTNAQPIWNVPVSFTSFIGREQEVATICQQLAQPAVRLVSLIGIGGIGKTRLSMQVAQAMRERFADGICFISLAAIVDPSLVLSTIAKTLAIQESETLSIAERVKSTLHNQQLLLILDNFEQVVAAAPLVEDLLASCPQLKILITSRAVLHLHTEQAFMLAPLALPDPHEELPATERLLQFAAVDLFVQRAQAILADFRITAQNARDIADICMCLDGLPLAIELAVRRIRLLSPHALLTRLTTDLLILKSNVPTVPERQQTLYNTITWSYNLLDEQAQWLFRQLSIFHGGCTLEAVEAIFGQQHNEQIDILQTIITLLDNSLLQQVELSSENPRFTMLETIRTYGQDSLRAHAELAVVERAHAMHYLTLVEQARPHLKGAHQAGWLAQLEPEQENLRAALKWFIGQQDTENALSFSEAFGKFYGLKGYWSEERYWLQVVLELPQTSKPTAMRAKVLRRAGYLAYRLGNLPGAYAQQKESIALSQASGDMHNLAGALSGLALVLYRQKDIAEALHLQRESVSAARASGDTWSIANALEGLGRFLHYQGHTSEAYPVLAESLALARELMDKESTVRILSTLVSIEISQGDSVQAAALAQEGLTLAQELGTRPLIAIARDSIGDVAMYKGEYAQAKRLFEERILLAQELGDRPTVAKKQLQLGDIALAEGDMQQATTLVQESLAFFREQNDHPNIATALHVLGEIKLAQQDLTQAISLYKEAFQLNKAVGDQRHVGKHLIGQAKIALAQGQPEQAAMLLGLAESWSSPQVDMHPAQRQDYEQAVTNVQTQLGAERFAAARDRGSTMTLEQVLPS